MARQQSYMEYIQSQRKRKKVKIRSKYNPTQAEAQRLLNDISGNSASREWGMSARMIDALIDRHKNGNAAMKNIVEEQLTDMNFHTLSKHLNKGDYKNALKWNSYTHKNMGTKPTKQYKGMYGMISG